MTADVVMLLEGTYPYIRGGVSSWVHQIICGMPNTTFHLIFLGGHPDHYGDMRYTLPDNVIALDKHYMMYHDDTVFKAKQGNTKAFKLWSNFQSYFQSSGEAVPQDLFEKMFAVLNTEHGISKQDFLYAEEAWKSLANTYLKHCPDYSFTQFFWTYRNLYAPLFLLAKIARQLPKARLYHTISTGYAGYLGAGAARLKNVPFLISEHGIYTKERKIDLAQADWIADEHSEISQSLSSNMSYIRRMWIRFFEQLGISSYQMADRIISLYEGNRQRQLLDGAHEQKTQIIPNGINISRFTGALYARPTDIPNVIGLIGRVVSIKDIKTFIRAILQTQSQLNNIQGWVIGPYDEDPDYYLECQQLVETLGLENQIKFLGMQNVVDILPQLGLTVLTSISEAQPLVLLEGMAAGVPFVASDVGSCREIAYGLTEEDKALGSAGEIVPIASPSQTAKAIIKLLSDPVTWHHYQKAGINRVQSIYDEQLMHKRYHDVYEDLM